MRVLHVIGEISKARGGPVAALQGMLEVTTHPSFENHVLCAAVPSEELPLPDPVTIHKFPLSFPARFLRSQQAAQWMRNHVQDYDLIVFHEIWPFVVIETALIASKSNTPYIVIPHNSLDPFDLVKKSALKKILGRIAICKILEKCKAVVAATARECRRFELYGTRPPVFTLPLSVPDRVSGGNRDAFREKLNIPADAFLLLFLGRIDPKKGIDLLLHACRLIRNEARPFHLAIVGGGNAGYESTIRSLASNGSLDDIVHFCGFLSGPERTDAFAAADLFVLPSRYENFGIAVIESMHAGVPTLISDEVFLSDEAVRADATALCKPEVQSLAKQILLLIGDASRRQDLSNNGKTFAAGFLPSALESQVREALLEFAEVSKIQASL